MESMSNQNPYLVWLFSLIIGREASTDQLTTVSDSLVINLDEQALVKRKENWLWPMMSGRCCAYVTKSGWVLERLQEGNNPIASIAKISKISQLPHDM